MERYDTFAGLHIRMLFSDKPDKRGKLPAFFMLLSIGEAKGSGEPGLQMQKIHSLRIAANRKLRQNGNSQTGAYHTNRGKVILCPEMGYFPELGDVKITVQRFVTRENQGIAIKLCPEMPQRLRATAMAT